MLARLIGLFRGFGVSSSLPSASRVVNAAELDLLDDFGGVGSIPAGLLADLEISGC